VHATKPGRYLEPRPRDFTAAVFKCRSTPTGSLPLDADLYQTLERGVHASAMPSWYALTKQERVDLIAYIKGFSARFKEEKPQQALSIPAEPVASQESITRGKDIFRKMECSKCHGAEGAATGRRPPRSWTARIRDNWNPRTAGAAPDKTLDADER